MDNKKIEDLKVIIVNEWTDDPPTSANWYYIASGTEYGCLKARLGESVDNVFMSVVEEDEQEELSSEYAAVEITNESLSSFCWDNGGVGVCVTLVAEGEQIIPQLYSFLEENAFELWNIEAIDDWKRASKEDWEELNIDKKTVKDILKAIKEPSNYDLAVRLIEIVNSWCEENNNNVW